MRGLGLAGEEEDSLVDLLRRVGEAGVGEVEAAKILDCCCLSEVSTCAVEVLEEYAP